MRLSFFVIPPLNTLSSKTEWPHLPWFMIKYFLFLGWLLPKADKANLLGVLVKWRHQGLLFVSSSVSFKWPSTRKTGAKLNCQRLYISHAIWSFLYATDAHFLYPFGISYYYWCFGNYFWKFFCGHAISKINK